MCTALLISVRNAIKNKLFCASGEFAISLEQWNSAELRVRSVARLMSSLDRDEGESTVNWASQKKPVEHRGMVFMSSLLTSVTSASTLVLEFFYSNSYCTDEEIENQRV